MMVLLCFRLNGRGILVEKGRLKAGFWFSDGLQRFKYWQAVGKLGFVDRAFMPDKSLKFFILNIYNKFINRNMSFQIIRYVLQ